MHHVEWQSPQPVHQEGEEVSVCVEGGQCVCGRRSVCVWEGVGVHEFTSGLVLIECLMSSTVSFCRKMYVCTVYT